MSSRTRHSRERLLAQPTPPPRPTHPDPAPDSPHPSPLRFDPNPSHQVDANEYVKFSLCDALSRASARVVDLFRQWDEDKSGSVDKREFRRAIKAIGFNFIADDDEIDMVFDGFDLDKSGYIDYKELNNTLRAGRSPQRMLMRQRSTVGGGTLVLDMDGDSSIQEQLRDALNQHAVRPTVDLTVATGSLSFGGRPPPDPAHAEKDTHAHGPAPRSNHIAIT